MNICAHAATSPLPRGISLYCTVPVSNRRSIHLCLVHPTKPPSSSSVPVSSLSPKLNQETTTMFRSPPPNRDELPDCFYKQNHPILIAPAAQTPNHHLYLSNLDDQRFLRFSIKYLYLFKKSVSSDFLKHSLSRVLVHYYPLAGRLSEVHDQKLEIDCNGEGAVFAEAFMDIRADEFLQLSKKPNKSWRKLLYRVEAQSFLDIPPLVVQVTNLACGGMILCTAINHCLCDGIGSSQFLHAWAHAATKPHHDLPIPPFHSRHVLRPRPHHLPKTTSTHPGYIINAPADVDTTSQYLRSQPLVPASITFTAPQILRLKRQLTPSLKCTTFEALASHTWRSWVRSLDLPLSTTVKLLFSVNVRRKLIPEMPEGYYGNGFVLGCAESGVRDLLTSNLHHGVKLVQEGKSRLTDDYVRSLIDVMEEDKTVKTDLTTSLVISQWARLGLEELDFGEGRPVHMGPLTSDIYCLFLPVVGDADAVRVMVSVPEAVHGRFEHHMTSGDHVEENNEFC